MPKIHTLTFNGTASSSLGIFITGAGTFNAADLDVTSYQIPGRNGDLIVSNNRYKNIRVEYPAFIPGGFESRAQSVRNWMRSATTYAKISDDYDTDHFRLGIPDGVQEFQPVNQNDAANFKLVFNCKPQRFLTSVAAEYQIANSYNEQNPTNYVALPLIRLVGSITGAAYIQVVNSLGTFKMTATSAYTGDVYIDSETMNIYSGSSNLNHLMTGDFPVLAPGSNVFTFSGVQSGVGCFRRYWEL